jgi:hypothetical protein
LWILALLVLLSIFVAVFGRFETFARRPGVATPPAGRSLAGAIAICVGLAALSIGGIGATGLAGIRAWPVLLTLAGGILVAAVEIPRLR